MVTSIKTTVIEKKTKNPLEIGFMNDIVFGTVMSENKEIYKKVILRAMELSKDSKILDEATIDQQRTFSPVLTTKGNRFDVLSTSESLWVDSEAQRSQLNRKSKEAPKKERHRLEKRTRSYEATLTVSSLPKGADYADLPDVVIIFFCEFDPFGLGYAKYVARESLYVKTKVDGKNRKLNVTEQADYDAGVTKIFLNVGGDVKHWNVSKDLKNLIDYIRAKRPTDALTQEINEKVVEVCERKKDDIMTLEEKLKEQAAISKAEGIVEGIAETRAEKDAEFHSKMVQTVKDMFQDGVPFNSIVKYSHLSKQEVEQIIREIKEKKDNNLLSGISS